MAVIVAVLAQKSLHEPRLGMAWIYVQNSVKKDLRYVPAFFRDCAGDVPTIDPDHRLSTGEIVAVMGSEESYR